MDKYEKCAASLMELGDKILEKKKHRNMLLRRVSFSCASVFAAVIVGFFVWKSTPPKIELPSETIISETTTIPESTYTDITSAQTTSLITTTSASKSEKERLITTASIQTQTVTTVATDATETPTTEYVIRQTETQTPSKTQPVTYTQPTTEVQITEPITTTEWVRPIAPLAQSISFTDINSIIDTINTNDLSSYSEQEREIYRNMFDRIKNDGSIYQINNTDEVSLIEDRGVVLFPYAAYEDVGIGYYVRYKEKIFHITFYYADHNLIAQTNDIAEYLQKRMGRRSDKTINVTDINVSLLFANDGQIYAGALIDKDHYYAVNTIASEEEMIEFLNAFSYEQNPLLS